MPQTYCDLARELGIREGQLEAVIKRAAISCDSEFNGNFLWLTDDLPVNPKNRVMLHTGSFGEFPVIGLPDINMLVSYPTARELTNNFGIDAVVSSIIKSVPVIPKPSVSNLELYYMSYFLSCLWVDIKQETYRCIGIYWNPLISFDTPVYWKTGAHKPWENDCNILRANILELIDSIYRFLIWDFNAYTLLGAKYMPVKFPMALSSTEDILKMPGVACLNTSGCKQVAFNTLTLIRSLIAQMCCILLRRGNDAFVIKPTTEATFAADIKQVYLLIQKMEAFINNG